VNGVNIATSLDNVQKNPRAGGDRIRDRPDFLRALLSGHEGNYSLEVDGQLSEVGPEAIAKLCEAGEVYVSAITPDKKVPFFWKLIEGVEDEDEWMGFKLAPSVVLQKNNDLLVAWALDKSVKATDAVLDLGFSLDEGFAEQPIPAPGTRGWGLVRANPDAFHTLEDMIRVYGSSEETQDASSGSKAEDDTPPWEEASYGEFQDAVIRTPGFDIEKLSQKITVSLAGNRESKNWKPTTMPLAALVTKLCQHEVGKKDGLSVVLADMIPGQRKNNSVKAISGLGIDIDTGMAAEKIDASLLKFKHLAIRYTTHSNASTRTLILRDTIVKKMDTTKIDTKVVRDYLREHEEWAPDMLSSVEYGGTEHTERGIQVVADHKPMPKNRIVIPFAEPFAIQDEGDTQKEALAKWKLVPAAVADALGVPLDRACLEAARLFYMPRHEKNRAFDISLFGGKLYDWRTLDLDNPLDAALKGLENNGRRAGGPTTAAGKDLGRWAMRAAHGFQIVTVLEDNCPDHIRFEKAPGNVEALCPFDEEHSNAGDPEDRGFFCVNAGDGDGDVFFARCRHDSCQRYNNLDHLAKMMKDGWFLRDVLTDPDYNLAGVEGAPNPEAAKRIAEEDRERAEAEAERDDALATYKADGEGLSKASSGADVAAVCDKAFAAGLSDGDMDRLRDVIIDRTEMRTGAVDGEFKAAKKRAAERQKAAEVKKQQAKWKSSKNPPRDCDELEPPPPRFGKFSLDMLDGDPWWFRKDDEGVTPAVSAYEIVEGFEYPERDGRPHGLIVELRTQSGKWRQVELTPAEWIKGGGGEALAKLREAGMRFHGKDGLSLVLKHLNGDQPPGWRLYDKPGFHGSTFLLPTGGAAPKTKKLMRMADSARIKADPPAGADAVEAFKWAKRAAKIVFSGTNRTLQSGWLLGLVGPGLDLTQAASVQYEYVGPSTTGKSSAQCLAVSHFGPPKLGEGNYISGNLTENSLEVPLERANGTILAIDEVRFLTAEKAQLVGYQIQQGTGKLRGGRTGGNRRQTKHCTVVVTSSETGIAARLAMEGKSHDAGLTVRVLPIRTDNQPLPTDKEIEAFGTENGAPVGWAFDHWGAIGPDYIKALVEFGYVENPLAYADEVDGLVAKLLAGNESWMARRSARLVAYLWQVALIAQRAELIPDSFDAAAFARTLWAETLTGDLAPETNDDKAVERLCETLVAKRREFPELTKRTASDGVTTYEVNEDIYREWLAVQCWASKPDGASRYNLADEDDDGAVRVYVVRAGKLFELGGKIGTERQLKAALEKKKILLLPGLNARGQKEMAHRGWNGLARAQYVVLLASKVEDDGEGDGEESDGEEDGAV
jgi:hypothetical protein